jgi:hypothetical protein
MRKTITSAALAALTMSFFASPALSGSLMPDMAVARSAGIVELATHYYGHKPKCVFKKVKRYDSYGNVIFKKIKICK